MSNVETNVEHPASQVVVGPKGFPIGPAPDGIRDRDSSGLRSESISLAVSVRGLSNAKPLPYMAHPISQQDRLQNEDHNHEKNIWVTVGSG